MLLQIAMYMPYIGPVGVAADVTTREGMEDCRGVAAEVTTGENTGDGEDVGPSVVVIISVMVWPFKTVTSGITHSV